MRRRCLILVFLLNLGAEQTLYAQPRHLYSSAVVSGMHLPVWSAKDLGLFQKYGLNVDVVVISGGTIGMQSLLGGSTQTSSSAAMGPINTVLAGGDAVVIGGVLNKNLLKFVARKEIRKPMDLIGKKIGVTGFGGSNEFGVLLALGEWKIPRHAVNIIPTGVSAARIASVEAGGSDATVLPYSSAIMAADKGFNTLGDLAEIVPEFPDRLLIVTRSFLKKERDTVKRYLQAMSESIYLLKSNRQRERSIASFAKVLRAERKIAEEIYDSYQKVFSFPPRVGKKGMRAVVEIMQQQTGRPKSDFELARFIDESVLDELEKEGFFKKLEMEYQRR
ncbi:MAG: ABC transporter substrate-binding protein [Candidatus Binatia bacterium]